MGREGLSLSCKMQNWPLHEEKSLLTGETEAVTGRAGPDSMPATLGRVCLFPETLPAAP